MGYFIGIENREFYVDDDGRVYNGVDKKMEYNPKTFEPIINIPLVDTTRVPKTFDIAQCIEEEVPERMNINPLPDPVMDELYLEKLEKMTFYELRKLVKLDNKTKIAMTKKELIKHIKENS